MALLDTFKKETKETATKKDASVKSGSAKSDTKKKETKNMPRLVHVRKSIQEHDVLRRPHITEKATMLSEKNAYVFEVDTRTNKAEIRKAIVSLYGVDPVKINVTTIPAKKVFSRKGNKGVKAGVKKAIIYLKKGDTIDAL